MRRDFGPRNFNHSHNGVRNTHKSGYVDQSGRIPTQPDKSHLNELLRQRMEAQRPPVRLIPEKFTDIELGIKDKHDALPIQAYKELIVSTIHANPVTIIVAETGAGKSTQMTQFLLEAGYTTSVPQPRRMAPRMVAERTADVLDESFGDDNARQ